MQKQNLKERNLKWISEIYEQKRKDYSRMQNIGWYKDLLSVDDLINDAYITFSTYNNIEEFEGSFDHLKNLFNKFIYWAQTASYSKHNKVVQKWKVTSQFYDFNNNDKEQQGTINIKNLVTTPYPEILEIEKEMDKKEYQLLKMYVAGYTGDELAYLLGFSRTTIMKYVDCQANQLKQKYVGDVKAIDKKINKYYFKKTKGTSKKSKVVINKSNGLTYASAKEAFTKGDANIKAYSVFTRMLRGEIPNKTNFQYVNTNATTD
jgi:hypothetical protein